MIKEISHLMGESAAFDGRPARVFSISNKQGMSVTLMDIGATWLDCSVPVDGQMREVLLSVADMPRHIKHGTYLGATVGRYANRITGGKFSIEGTEHTVLANQSGNCLHGGPDGFNRRRWDAEITGELSLRFTLVSPDGDQGFPGNLTAQVEFTLTEQNAVEIRYTAETDKACPVNLTNHAYFNLSGAESGADCLGHSLQVRAARYVATNAVGIPTGELKQVEGNGFDFRQSKAIKQDFLTDEDQKQAKGYDHAFVLDSDVQDGERVAATLVSPDRKLSMSVLTTKPAIQVYTGNYLAGTPSRQESTPITAVWPLKRSISRMHQITRSGRIPFCNPVNSIYIPPRTGLIQSLVNFWYEVSILARTLLRAFFYLRASLANRTLL